MNNQKGLISTIILIVSFVLVVVIVGGAVYLDATNNWDKIGFKATIAEENTDGTTNTSVGGDQPEEQIIFVPYQSPDKLYQLQIPDFWTGEERAGAVIFYSYNPADGQPEQRAKIEIGRVANPDRMTSVDWLAEHEIDVTTAQQAIFGDVSGAMILQDNTEANPSDIKSIIYMPVNDQVLVITAESFGGTRDVAVQFFNAILNSWQWIAEVTSPDLLAAEALNEDANSNVSDSVDTEEDLGEGDVVDNLEPVGDNLEGNIPVDEDGGGAPPEEILE